MEAPLARDQDGNPFELPEEASWWRVRLQTTGRPRAVLGPDRKQLYVPILAGAAELEEAGCEGGSYRLEAVDADHQPIEGVPVAVVELAGVVDQAPSSHELVPTFLDPPRSATEALVRSVEAMQRTQLERERHQAERERWQMQAMVEGQRSLALICTSLIERLKPAQATPSDPLTQLRQQLEAKKILDNVGGRRNGALLAPAPEGDKEKKPNPVLAMVENVVAPFVPVGVAAATQFVTNKMSKGDPVHYKQMNRNVEATMRVVAAALGGQSQEQAVHTAIDEMTKADADDDSATSPDDLKAAMQEAAAEEDEAPPPAPAIPDFLYAVLSALTPEEKAEAHALFVAMQAHPADAADALRNIQALPTDEQKVNFVRRVLANLRKRRQEHQDRAAKTNGAAEADRRLPSEPEGAAS